MAASNRECKGQHLLDVGKVWLGMQDFKHSPIEDVQVVVLQVCSHGHLLVAQQSVHGQPNTPARLGGWPEEQKLLLLLVQT